MQTVIRMVLSQKLCAMVGPARGCLLGGRQPSNICMLSCFLIYLRVSMQSVRDYFNFSFLMVWILYKIVLLAQLD